MSYKLIALDIDGTIRSDDYPLSERTRNAMNKVREAGAHVTVATGRVFRSAVRATGELDIRTPIASFQGAHIANPVTSEVLWHRPLTFDMACAAYDALDSWGLEVIGYLDDEIYVRKTTAWSESYSKRNGVKINVVEDVEELASNGLTRLVVVGDNDKIKLLEADMKAQFTSDDLYVTRSLAHFCEILHPHSGKDKALEWLCGYLGITQDETIAFGNGYNDVQMIDWAGLGVAIGGAVDEVLEVADRVAPPIEEDGAARVLEELLEKGMIG